MSSGKTNTRIKVEWKVSAGLSTHFLGTIPTISCRAVIAVFLFALLTITGGTAQTQNETVLYSFTGAADGANPFASLVQDQNGNLYGTAEYGGNSGCFGYGCGTLFKISPAGAFAVLYTFSGGADGGIPVGGLILDGQGNLYGTTSYGASLYDGTVFELARNGALKVLHTFTGAPDGANPVASLVWDEHGSLYGTTPNGGSSGAGALFKVNPHGTEKVVYSFRGQPDGWLPSAALVRDDKGNFYGTTYQGGAHGWGSVFKVDPTGVETVLYSFAGLADGAFSFGGLLKDGNGSIYGTTVYTGGFSGYGTVFEVTATGTETVLHTFADTDGAYPQGILVRDKHGNFYGTTPQGGAFKNGTVFKLTPTGMETVLYSFTGGVDGSYPRAGLLRDGHGNLYGTTQYGGAFNYGTVFKIVP